MQPVSRSRRHARGSSLLLAALATYACSFQDFDYLKKGSEGSGGSGGGSGSGGQPALGGGGQASGGVATAGGSSGGAAPNGGGPAAAGQGGESGGGAAGSEQGGNGGSAGDRAGAAGAELGGAGGAGGTGGVDVGGAAGSGTGGRTTLVNPSFELGVTGWTVDPEVAATKGYIYFQFPPTGATAVHGSFIASVWNGTDEYQFSVYQALDGLEDGLYTFKGYFSSTLAREVYVFARNCGGVDQTEVVATNSFPWHEVGISGINVVGGRCEVGFFVHGIPNDWLNVDLLSFERDPQ